MFKILTNEKFSLSHNINSIRKQLFDETNHLRVQYNVYLEIKINASTVGHLRSTLTRSIECMHFGLEGHWEHF